MNSLSILSSQVERVIGSTPPSTPRNIDFKRGHKSRSSTSSKSDDAVGTDHGEGAAAEAQKAGEEDDSSEGLEAVTNSQETADAEVDEKTSLLPSDEQDYEPARRRRRRFGFSRLERAATAPFKALWTTLKATTTWVSNCFYDDHNRFSLLMPLYHLSYVLVYPFSTRREIPILSTSVPQSTAHEPSQYLSNEKDSSYDDDDSFANTLDQSLSDATAFHNQNMSSTLRPDASNSSIVQSDGPPASLPDEIAPRRSIRIRLFNQDNLQHKSRSIKSPTSPSSSLRLTRYPRNVGPPRPLLPKHPSQKTLILDLDETLIHSMSKGGRMSSGHMVEVKLDKQHAILYYVHKRPFCDDFLKKVCKWYNVVIFTASVQEYADPVIDWLDAEGKFFSARYYRQHCTFRDGVYIKDISLVEPDLSKVMIVDNSPTSYIFHKDNAIPIEGWISDPTDHELLHLVPVLQGLQYVTDVRAFLALRMGEAFSQF